MYEDYKRLTLTTSTLPTAQTVLYTAPANSSVIIKHILVNNNNTTINRNASLWHGTARVLPTATIDAGGWGEFEGTIILNAGETLSGQVDAGTDVQIVVYALEVS
jgi:hypothetical protein